jgi:hippurate hydrolase
MSIIKEIQNNHTDMTNWRKHIHQHPETAYLEVQTAEFVKKKLTEFGIPFHYGLGKTGVVGIIEGKQKGKMAIGLRADMDALPMEELNTFEHRSKNKGCMHACGHDGHTTMLLGAAKYLNATKNFVGTVYLIFQPAEEGMAGAKAMINDGLFKKFPMDEVYAVHNWPGDKLGVFKIKAGPMLAANDRFEIKIQGKGCHAALPETGFDPIVMGAQVVLAIQTIVSRNISPLNSAVVSVTMFNGGSAFNVIPDEVTLCGTVRTLDENIRQLIFTRIKDIAEGISKTMGGSATFKLINGYPVTVNYPEQTKYALQAAEKIVGKENIIDDFPVVSMGSEDFSFMLKEKPGCYVFIGNDGEGNNGPCMLHNPYYDFNDKILPIGASYFVALAEQRLV